MDYIVKAFLGANASGGGGIGGEPPEWRPDAVPRTRVYLNATRNMQRMDLFTSTQSCAIDLIPSSWLCSAVSAAEAYDAFAYDSE